MKPSSSAKSLRLVVLVSGRGTNLGAIIDAAQKQIIQSKIKLVISNQPKALALERAKKAGIPYQIIPSQGRDQQKFFNDLKTAVAAQKPDLIILAGFMKILPRDFTQKFRYKIINIHPALLPSFPGLHAQKQALEAGVAVTGCTVHFVDEGCDTGSIILQKTERLQPGDTEETLSQRLLQKEHACLVEAIKLFEEEKVVLQGDQTLLRKS